VTTFIDDDALLYFIVFRFCFGVYLFFGRLCCFCSLAILLIFVAVICLALSLDLVYDSEDFAVFSFEIWI
jgi:4-hydroxybenzoate polyprenyltransferase